MIAQITGTLTTKTLDHIEVMTSGGVGYLLQIPLSVYEALPKPGETVTLPTALVVKEDQWQLFGFTSALERRVFEKLLTASGIGPALAIGLLSSLTTERLIRAIVERDIPTLQGVPRVGHKKAERLILDLADKFKEIAAEDGDGGVPRRSGANVEDAIRALVSLGYTTADAEKGVRAALDTSGPGLSAPELIRVALAKIGGR
jgi:Holliday junction DNA helicase RuvA